MEKENKIINDDAKNKFYSKALLTGNTKSMIKQFLNVKSSVKITQFGSSWERTLEVFNYFVNKELCKLTFEQAYLLEVAKGTSMSFEEFFLDQVANGVSDDLERMIWQDDEIGLLKKFEEDTNVLKIKGAKLSPSNIIVELNKAYSEIPSTIRNSPALVTFMNNRTMLFYKQAIENSSFSSKIQIVPVAGILDNTIVFAEKTNLWCGADLLGGDDLIIRESESTLSLKGGFKFGTQYGESKEIVYYYS